MAETSKIEWAGALIIAEIERLDRMPYDDLPF